MYLPGIFREDAREVAQEIILRHSFGTLVTSGERGLFATHLPFLLDGEAGPGGALLGHVARANPQWRDLRPDAEVLAFFQGPHSYVTPAWYREKLHVPTWNYVAVHVRGRPRILPPSELLDLLRRLVDTHEAQFPRPWSVAALPGPFVEDMLQEIVGFAIAITRVDCKLKLSQNRDAEDRQRVALELAKSSDPESRATAEWMRRREHNELPSQAPRPSA
jgi:transcriptional regulator